MRLPKIMIPILLISIDLWQWVPINLKIFYQVFWCLPSSWRCAWILLKQQSVQCVTLRNGEIGVPALWRAVAGVGYGSVKEGVGNSARYMTRRNTVVTRCVVRETARQRLGANLRTVLASTTMVLRSNSGRVWGIDALLIHRLVAESA
jgi:hypothetical protein